MPLKDNEKNRKLLKNITQHEWDNLTHNQQYDRILFKEKIGDSSCLRYISYNKQEIIRKRNNSNLNTTKTKPVLDKDLSNKSKNKMPSDSDVKSTGINLRNKLSDIAKEIIKVENVFLDEFIKEKDEEISELRDEISSINKVLKEHTLELSEVKERIIILEDENKALNEYTLEHKERIIILEDENKFLRKEYQKFRESYYKKLNAIANDFKNDSMEISKKIDSK